MNIYDFDKTIYDGDSTVDFFKFCFKKNKKMLLDIIPIGFSLFIYLIKIKEKEYFKSTFFRFLKRIDVDNEVADFWKSHEYKIKDFYKKQHKDTDIIISASPLFLINPIAEKYKFSLIATNVDKKTGRLIDKNCYGEEKVKRLKELDIVKCDKFYSDSLSDTPCSNIAKKSYIVKNNDIIPWKDYHEEKTLIKTFMSRDFITFVFIGFINAFNGVWIAYVYSLFIKGDVLAYILGFLTSLCIAYILNSLLNFKCKLSLEKFLKFAINNIPNFLIQVFSVVVLLKMLECPKIISYMISAVIAVPITFLLVKINVFKEKNIDNKDLI